MKRLVFLLAITLTTLILAGCGLSTPADRNDELVQRLDTIIYLLEHPVSDE